MATGTCRCRDGHGSARPLSEGRVDLFRINRPTQSTPADAKQRHVYAAGTPSFRPKRRGKCRAVRSGGSGRGIQGTGEWWPAASRRSAMKVMRVASMSVSKWPASSSQTCRLVSRRNSAPAIPGDGESTARRLSHWQHAKWRADSHRWHGPRINRAHPLDKSPANRRREGRSLPHSISTAPAAGYRRQA